MTQQSSCQPWPSCSRFSLTEVRKCQYLHQFHLLLLPLKSSHRDSGWDLSPGFQLGCGLGAGPGAKGLGRSEAPLPKSLRQWSALLSSCPEAPRGPSEGPGPTSQSPPGQASASAQRVGRAPPCPPCCLPSSSFQAQVPRTELPRNPHHGVHPCWPGFGLQIFPDPFGHVTLSPIKAYPSSVPLSLALLRDMDITVHGGPWVTGSCPQFPICASPEPPLTVGVASGGFSDTMTGRGMGCSRDRNTAGQQAGGGPALGACTDLPLSFLAFGPNSP